MVSGHGRDGRARKWRQKEAKRTFWGRVRWGGGGDKKEGGAPCLLRVLKGRRHPQEFNWPLRAVYPLNAVVSLPVWPLQLFFNAVQICGGAGPPETFVVTLFNLSASSSRDFYPAGAGYKLQSTSGRIPSEK